MKSFKEFIQESSLTRLKSKSDKGGMAVLSGSRGDKSAKENRARAKQLDKDIRGKGLPGATKVTGRYDEKDDKTGKVTKVKERSHVVTSGKMGKESLRKQSKHLVKNMIKMQLSHKQKVVEVLHLKELVKVHYQKEIYQLEK